ncbi:hypothetical protein C0J52_01624 [Blattella germanica]|nr:hypothetical protein C0J52_01624 [Blattella germanica]
MDALRLVLENELEDDDEDFEIDAIRRNVVAFDELFGEEIRRHQPNRNVGYLETTVPRYTPEDFRAHFRMSR